MAECDSTIRDTTIQEVTPHPAIPECEIPSHILVSRILESSPAFRYPAIRAPLPHREIPQSGMASRYPHAAVQHPPSALTSNETHSRLQMKIVPPRKDPTTPGVSSGSRGFGIDGFTRALPPFIPGSLTILPGNYEFVKPVENGISGPSPCGLRNSRVGWRGSGALEREV